MESARVYRAGDAFCDMLTGFGVTAMLFSVGFFLFILFGAIPNSHLNPYLGLVTGVFLPLIFVLGAVLFFLRRIIAKRLNR